MGLRVGGGVNGCASAPLSAELLPALPSSHVEATTRWPLAEHTDEYQCKVQNIINIVFLYVGFLYVIVRGFRTCCSNRLVH